MDPAQTPPGDEPHDSAIRFRQWLAHPWWLLPLGAALSFGASAGPHIFDAGELAAAAATLGGSHPPGQPLYSITAHLAKLIPLGPMVFRFALFSTATAIAASWQLFRFTQQLLNATPRSKHETPPKSLATAAPHAAALALLLTPAVSAQATRIEVYPLALALTIAGFRCLHRWAHPMETNRAADHRGLLAGAIFGGLAWAVHPPHALALVLFGAVQLAFLLRNKAPKPGITKALIAIAPGFFLLGWSVHTFLPLRDLAGAPMWEVPSTLEGFWRYVSAQAYTQNLAGQAELNPWPPAEHLLLAVSVLPWLLIATGQRRLWRFAALVAGAGALFITPFDADNPDQFAYTGPAVALLLAFGATAAVELQSALRARFPDETPAQRHAVSALLLLLIATNPLSIASAADNLDANRPALETLGALLTDQPPPRALVVLRSDYAGATWQLARHLEGARPDVAFASIGLLSSSWQWNRLAAHPAFDGRPQRGRGEGHDAWLDGLLHLGHGQVSLLVEDGRPLPELHGAYLAAPGASTDATRGVESPGLLASEDAFAEVSAAVLGGNDDLAAGVLRDHLLRRTLRFGERGRHDEALATLPALLAHLQSPHNDVWRALEHNEPEVAGVPAAIVNTPGPHATRGDAMRAAAVVLQGQGRFTLARQVLGAAFEDGDVRSLLQLALLEAAAGRTDEARRALRGFRTQAPELASEGDVLEARLRPP